MKHQLYTEQMKKFISNNKYEEIHIHLLQLSWKQQVAIQMRFWEECTIFQIASHLRVSWDEADDLIETSLKKLKDRVMQSMNHSSKPSAA